MKCVLFLFILAEISAQALTKPEIVAYQKLSFSAQISVQPLINPKIVAYLKSQRFTLKDHRNSLAIVNPNVSDINHLLTAWSPTLKIPVQVINGPILSAPNNVTKFEHAVVLMEDLDKVNGILFDLLSSPLVFFSDPNYYMVIVTSCNLTSEELKEQLKLIWDKHQTYTFVVIFVNDNDNLEIIGYDPFEDKMLNYSALHSGTVPFRRDIRNLKGYKLRVVIDPLSYPDLDLKTLTCNKTDSCLKTNLLLKYMNAQKIIVSTGHIRDTYTNMETMLRLREYDVGFIEIWTQPETLPGGSYPVIQSQMVALVPRGKMIPMFLNVLHVFDKYTWLLIVLFKPLSGMFMTLLKYSNKYHFNITMAIVLTSRYIFDLIFEYTFQSGVITALTSPKFEKDIDTVADLVNSGLKIYGPDAWINMTDKFQMYPLFYIDLGHSLWNLSADQAYLATEAWAKTLLANRTNNKYKREYYVNYYHLVKEPVAKSGISYGLQTNSPYRNVFTMFILHLNDYGFTKEFGGNRTIKYDPQTTALQQLNMNHLSGAFIPLILGWISSNVVLLLEITWFIIRRPVFIS